MIRRKQSEEVDHTVPLTEQIVRELPLWSQLPATRGKWHWEMPECKKILAFNTVMLAILSIHYPPILFLVWIPVLIVYLVISLQSADTGDRLTVISTVDDNQICVGAYTRDDQPYACRHFLIEEQVEAYEYAFNLAAAIQTWNEAGRQELLSIGTGLQRDRYRTREQLVASHYQLVR